MSAICGHLGGDRQGFCAHPFAFIERGVLCREPGPPLFDDGVADHFIGDRHLAQQGIGFLYRLVLVLNREAQTDSSPLR